MTQNNQIPPNPAIQANTIPPQQAFSHPAASGTNNPSIHYSNIPASGNQPCPTCGRRNDPDEINLLEYVYVLVKNKWWIIGMTILGIALGFTAAIIKGPRYVAEAVIAPKESESQRTPNLSAFGAFGGLAAAQLGLGGNASLDKIELIINSREFNASFIEKNGFLPEIYRYQWPKVYAREWDASAKDWKATFVKPKRLDMGAFLKGAFVKATTKNNTMTLTATSKDSTFSEQLLTQYLAYLGDYIKTNVQTDAKQNVDYLNTQLETAVDPLLREKIQGLMANELEKSMLVSKEAFTIVDSVYRSMRFKEKKLLPLVFGFGLCFLTSLLVLFGHAVSSGSKTEDDKQLIAMIKKEMIRIG